MIVELKGIITKVYGRELFTYSLHDGERASEFTSKVFLQPGESIKASCEVQEKSGKTTLIARNIEKLPDIYPEIENKIMKLSALKPARLENEMEKLRSEFEKVARKIYAANVLGRFVSVKFHGDADGISSALILRKFLKAWYSQQNSAIYSVADALRDMERMDQQFKPLLVLLDFGSGEDSTQGLELAKAAGIEIISIDHHPPCFNISETSINPWNAGIDDGSKYPTGYLCAQLAKFFNVDSEGYERIACAGDKSYVLLISKEDNEKALVLDFVATYAGFGNGIEFYSKVLSNKWLFNSILLQANAKMEELDIILEKNVKRIDGPKATVYLLNLDRVSEKREFPRKGKITSRLFEKVNKNQSVVIIGYGKRSMIFRLNDAALANGLRADELIKKMRAQFADFVDNGGGHSRAAALRIKEGFENAAVEEIVKMIMN